MLCTQAEWKTVAKLFRYSSSVVLAFSSPTGRLASRSLLKRVLRQLSQEGRAPSRPGAFRSLASMHTPPKYCVQITLFRQKVKEIGDASGLLTTFGGSQEIFYCEPGSLRLPGSQ